ncbi:MAG TPA: sigma 54-interacting transcriptional regulator, partial [bacterium]|nr:sigma 54-interacting transcriptional regulator [bacterium]
IADGGTLFLDEIGDLQPQLQVKLLRAVQEKSFERVGSNQTRKVNFRLIAATHQDLRKAVLEGRFREDLFYRLFVFPIQLPALKDRPEDIPLLAEHFLKRFNALAGKRFSGISPEAMDLLQGHPWPGNVRELENCLERAVAMHDGDRLEARHLRFEAPSAGSGQALYSGTADAPKAEIPADAWAPVDAAERDAIVRQLQLAGQRVPEAAKRLGMSRATLYRKMKKLGITSLN